ncbi:CTTNBP2 N-terminal-like protein [Penaeus monodon]|uniref:CTTNBP2 N-terminal-like protein n=1 Tax=Penaeus monodon TaxID=6687 RepID=UPI0018A701BC|nr:CTTNBP2 N-terminal-like protein [Penaeus monodon]
MNAEILQNISVCPSVCRAQSAVIFFRVTWKVVGLYRIDCGHAPHCLTDHRCCLPCPAARSHSQGHDHRPQRMQAPRTNYPLGQAQEDAGPQDELPSGPGPRLAPARSAMASGGALSDSGTAVAGGLEMQQRQLAQLEAWLIDRLGAQVGDQLACMQAQMQMQMQAQIQALATLLKGQQPKPSNAAEEILPAVDAMLPPSLSTIQTCSEEATGQQPRLPPSVPVGPQPPAFVASYSTSAVDDQLVRDRRDVTGPQQMATPTPGVVSAPLPPTLSGTEAATQPRPPVLPQPTQYGPPPQYTVPVLKPTISTHRILQQLMAPRSPHPSHGQFNHAIVLALIPH